MRKVLFTESQIKRIKDMLSESGFGGAYNPKEKYGSGEIVPNSPEVSAQDIDGEPIDTDEFGSSETQNGYPYGTFSGKHMFEGKKKTIKEQNSALKSTNVHIPNRVLCNMPDSKQKDNIIANGGKVSVNTADQIIHRSKESGNFKQAQKFLSNQVGTKRENQKTIKKTQPNGFIKPHEKNGTGKAHSEKPEFTFSYEY